MDDDLVRVAQLGQRRGVAQIACREPHARVPHATEPVAVAPHDRDPLACLGQQPRHARADEPGAAGHEHAARLRTEHLANGVHHTSVYHLRSAAPIEAPAAVPISKVKSPRAMRPSRTAVASAIGHDAATQLPYSATMFTT